jgi:lipid A oxidase
MSRHWFCLLLSALAPVSVSAQWTASGYIGKTHTADANIQVTSRPDTDVTFKNVAFDDRSFDSPLYYGVRAGYMLTRSAGVEGELMHIKAFARVHEPVAASGTLPTLGDGATTVAPDVVLQQYGVSHGLNLVLRNLVLRHALTSRIGVSGRAGLGIAVPHPEIRAFGVPLEEYQLHGAAIQFAGGGDFELSRHVFWLAEYKFTTTRQHFELGSTTIENTFATHHLVTGLGFRF